MPKNYQIVFDSNGAEGGEMLPITVTFYEEKNLT